MNQEVGIGDDQAEENAEGIAMKPTNKAETMSAAVNLMGIMPQDMLVNCFEYMVQQMQYNAENIPSGWPSKNASDMSMHPSFATGSVQEATRESLTQIFGADQNLSEEFKQKAQTLFEAALSARLVLEKEVMKAKLDEENEEYLSEAVDNLIENIDQYLTYVAEEWVKENQVAIEPALRTEMTEDFIIGLKTLFDQHYVNIPDEKIDVVDDLANKLEESEQKLNQLMEKNLELGQINEELLKQEIVNELSQDLVISQREKLRQLVEDFNVDEKLPEKIKVIKEKHFGIKQQTESNILEEAIEVQDQNPAVVDKTMRTYVNFASKVVRK